MRKVGKIQNNGCIRPLDVANKAVLVRGLDSIKTSKFPSCIALKLSYPHLVKDIM